MDGTNAFRRDEVVNWISSYSGAFLPPSMELCTVDGLHTKYCMITYVRSKYATIAKRLKPISFSFFSFLFNDKLLRLF